MNAKSRLNKYQESGDLKDLEALVPMVASLDDSEFKVIYMRYFRDLSFRQISKATNKSISWVFDQHRKGLSSLDRMEVEDLIMGRIRFGKHARFKVINVISGEVTFRGTQDEIMVLLDIDVNRFRWILHQNETFRNFKIVA